MWGQTTCLVHSHRDPQCVKLSHKPRHKNSDPDRFAREEVFAGFGSRRRVQLLQTLSFTMWIVHLRNFTTFRRCLTRWHYRIGSHWWPLQPRFFERVAFWCCMPGVAWDLARCIDAWNNNSTWNKAREPQVNYLLLTTYYLLLSTYY